MRKEEIIDFIVTAFKDVSREGGVSLHETRVMDAYGSDQERREARKRDKDKHWSEIADSDIEDHQGLYFMDPVSLRYHFPAYMIWSLKNYKKSDSASSDHTIYATIDDQVRFSLFNEEQSRAVAFFLKYMLNNHDGQADDTAAHESLEKYWERFL